jgi:cytochrome P450
LGEVVFSRSHKVLESGDESGFQRFRKALKSAAWIVHASWLFRLHQKTVPVFGNWLAASTLDHGYSYLFVSQELAARKDDASHGAGESDILSQLIAFQEKKIELDDAKIAWMVTAKIFNGPDTTVTALSGEFYLLLTHPEVYQRVVRVLHGLFVVN